MCYCLVTNNIDYDDNNDDDDNDDDDGGDDAESMMPNFNLTISEPAENAVCCQSCKMSE